MNAWTGQFEWSPTREEAIRAIRRAAGEVEAIFIASDPDREGEVIAQEVCDVLGKSDKIKRATWAEITPKAIEAGLAAAREVDQDKVDAGLARRFVDRLDGYTRSPWLSRKLGQKGLSAGRVQSVAARLVVERDRAIEQFVPILFGGASLTATSGGKTFKAILAKVNGLQVVGPEKEGKPGCKVLTPAEASALPLPKRGDQLTVLSMETKPQRKAPKPPFVTATMTVAAATRLGLNTETTMKVAQKLYEEGLITYHRSDSPNVSEDAIKMARASIEKEYGRDHLPGAPRQYKAKGDTAQEGHECIRPSHLEAAYAKDRAEHMANAVAAVGKSAEDLYDLILKRFLACQMADKQMAATVANLSFGPEDALVFKASGTMTTFEGWEAAYAEDEGEEEEGGTKEKVEVLPTMAKGARIPVQSCEATSRKTRTPMAYTEATLTEELTERNIGRPSTLATLFATLRNRGYVDTRNVGKRKDVLTSTPLGRKAVDALVAQSPQEMDYDRTAKMEADLGDIARGKLTIKAFMDGFWKELSSHF
jgi:DNA topoisomerase-1